MRRNHFGLIGFEELEVRRPLASFVVGDADCDGMFGTSDLVQVFAEGKFETRERADWSQGDWNADERFDSGDLVVAFQAGYFERSVEHLNVLTYNIGQLTVFEAVADFDRESRHIAQFVGGYDVIIFQEAFHDGSRAVLLDALRDTYPFQTRVLGRDRGFEKDGGVVIVSKWPIEREFQRLFGSVCSGFLDNDNDCLADKGVLYARVRKDGKPFHVFGTHLDAGDSDWPTRLAQLSIIKNLMNEMAISEDEPVILGGDLNVDLHRQDHYEQMQQLLMATHPLPISKDFTEHGLTTDNAYLDYVLYSDDHLVPDTSFNDRTVIPNDPADDEPPSDHVPVHGNFVFADYDVTKASSFPYAVFLEGNNASQDYMCNLLLIPGTVLEAQRHYACDNDKARSLVLYDVPAGRTIRIFDSSSGDQDDDWIEILAKRDISIRYISTFEQSLEDEDIIVRYHHHDGLDGEVSRIEVRDDVISGPHVADFNGNGRMDIANVDWGTISIAFSNGDGTFQLTNEHVDSFDRWAAHPQARSLTGDFNNDGRTDIALTGPNGWQTLPVAFSNGDGTFQITNEPIDTFASWAAHSQARSLTGDFNNDGRTDIALTGPNGWQTLPVAFSNGDGTFQITNEPIDFFASWAAHPQARSLTGDFNNDGRTDIALTGPNGWQTLPVAFSNGDGTFQITNGPVDIFGDWAAHPQARSLTGDFNNDGRTDIALTGPNGWQTLPVAFSNGDGTFQITNGPVDIFGDWAAHPQARSLTGDFNNDGRTDIALTGPNGWQTLPVAFSNGDGTFQITNEPIDFFASWAAHPQAKSLTGDFNNDGRTDLALTGPDGWQTIPVAFSSGDGTFQITNERSLPRLVALEGTVWAAAVDVFMADEDDVRKKQALVA